jgi:hypothetical protein
MAQRDNLGGATNMGSSAGAGDWTTEDTYWRSNFASRPYAKADRGYEAYQPGYRYGFESAKRYGSRKWNEVESDLRTGWDKLEYKSQSTWENVKDAVRDAWDRVTGGDRRPDIDRDSSRSAY